MTEAPPPSYESLVAGGHGSTETVSLTGAATNTDTGDQSISKIQPLSTENGEVTPVEEQADETLPRGFAHERLLKSWLDFTSSSQRQVYLMQIWASLPAPCRDDWRSDNKYAPLKWNAVERNDARSVSDLLKGLQEIEASSYASQGWWDLPHPEIEILVSKAFGVSKDSLRMALPNARKEENLPGVLRR